MSQPRDPGTLEALLESAKLLHASLDLDQLLRHLLRSVMGHLVVSRAVLALDEDGEMRVVAGRGVGALKKGTAFDEDAARAHGITHVFTLGDPSSPTGILGIGQPARGALNPEDEDFLDALLGLAATAIDNAHAHAREHRLATDLDRKVQELGTLLDMVRGLTASLDPSEVARLLGFTVSGQWLLRRFAVVAGKEGHPPVLRRRGIRVEDPPALFDAASGLDSARLVASLDSGALRAELEAQGVAAVVPMRAGETAIGLLALGAKGDGSTYSEHDLGFASGLAAQAVVAFENAWYFAETVERRKLEQELALAAEIQMDLFPKELPALSGFDVAARNIPALHVGGDYYDAIAVGEQGPEQPHLLTVADVSGKGIAASLLMANIQAMFRALLGPETSLTELASRSNELIWSTTPANKYATAFLTIADPLTGRCRHLSAGHNDTMLLRADGTLELLSSSGAPIGLLEGAPYQEGEITMHPGDVMAFYSDGVTEANDIDEEEFEEERLIDCLREVADRPAAEIVDAVFTAVDQFATGAPQYDDITLMVLKRVAD